MNLCKVAEYAGLFWDFIDKRDIDKHAMVWFITGISAYMVFWIFEFIWENPKSGVDIGVIVAAIMVPWTPVQAAAIKWYFDARQS